MTKIESTVAPSGWETVTRKQESASLTEWESVQTISPWKPYEKILFRFFFIYFFIQAVPLDWKYYQYLFSIDWTALHFRDIFYLSRYFPQFFPGQTFANWGVVALIAFVGTVLWSYRDRNAVEYNRLYYWLRVILRYRLAAGVIAYGFIKLFPLQAPLPSISHLNTPYGDFTDWKLFSLSLGIVPSYESFLGLVELTAGLLLLFRRTATVATLVILPFLGNVFVSNLAYEGGEYVYSFLLVTIALFLFTFDAQRLFTLLTLEKPTLPNRFQPVFSEKWQRQTRLALKSGFVLFFVFLYGYKTYASYRQGGYQYPQTAGLTEASGVYNVTEFRINHQVVPYSAADGVANAVANAGANSIRWKDVVFEKWATLSIRSNRPVKLESALTEEVYTQDNERNYELAGSAGRHYYSYQIDSVNSVLTLQNRNKNYPEEKLVLHYTRPTPSRIILSGTNERNDSLYVVLDKLNKKYLLEEAVRNGRRKGLKL